MSPDFTNGCMTAKNYWHNATPRRPRFAKAGAKRRFSFIVVDSEGRVSRQWHAKAAWDVRVPEDKIKSLLGQRNP